MQLIADNASSPQTLNRTPEPDLVTNAALSVAQYDRVLDTNMSANYAVTLDLIHRNCGDERRKALDLCSGPGFVALSLHRYLGFESVEGVDLSAAMLDVARENARNWQTPVSFAQQDITALNFKERSFDLVTWTNASHHLPTLSDVSRVLERCDRIAREDGAVILTDVGRLKTRAITERFVELAGEEYRNLGMNEMYQDFLHSMLAAWTADELLTCIPKASNRSWFVIAPKGLTNYVAVIGLPVGVNQLFVRDGLDWAASGLLRSKESRSDFPLLKQIVEDSDQIVVSPARKVA